jgi:hypothetical protein
MRLLDEIGESLTTAIAGRTRRRNRFESDRILRRRIGVSLPQGDMDEPSRDDRIFLPD